MKNKAEVRREIMRLRSHMSPRKRAAADYEIFQKVIARPEIVSAHTVCVYASLPSEVDTRALTIWLRANGKTVVVPPKSPDEIKDISAIDLFILPGVAFDPQGNRLGRGGGYYDRILAKTKAIIIGLAYQYQIVSGLPHGRYDIPVYAVITDHTTYECTTTS